MDNETTSQDASAGSQPPKRKLTKASSYQVDGAILDAGVWVKPDPDKDLEICCRNLGDRWIDLRATQQRLAAAPLGGDQTRLGNAKQRELIADALLECVFVDARGLSDEDGNEVTRDGFISMLRDPNFGPLVTAVLTAASLVSNMRVEELRRAKGN